jgi:hypothetical protein
LDLKKQKQKKKPNVIHWNVFIHLARINKVAKTSPFINLLVTTQCKSDI